ncbi:MAG TPA: RNA polymerase sigma factor [Candidatus Methylacidiphilales bacterium]
MKVFPSDLLDEESLIQAASLGDQRAFEDLFRRYYDMIHAYAYRMCFDAAEAADLTQETWIKAARHLPSYEGRASFKNWLYAIAHRVVLDAGRRKARQRRLLERAEIEAQAETEASSASGAVSESLHRALLSLPWDHRAAVTLVYLEGMNHREAAKVLGCAETTVSWRLFQARRKLKHVLTTEENG